LLLEKYFGVEGRKRALGHIKSEAQPDVFFWVKNALNQFANEPGSRFTETAIKNTPQIKVFGKGLYHKVRNS
jgi:hypothetical protein